MDLDNHPSTTTEIRALCQDLGVLGRVDFKLLLKWRLAVRKTAGLDKGKKKPPLKGNQGAGVILDKDEEEEEEEDDDEDDKGTAANEDEKLLDEMEELQQGMDARVRRDKKKKAKVKAKERMRTALGLQGQDSEGAAAFEMDLFSLARVKSKVSAWGQKSVILSHRPGSCKLYSNQLLFKQVR
jgi:AdoMet-dependent rRNA methyltransferase SPB1